VVRASMTQLSKPRGSSDRIHLMPKHTKITIEMLHHSIYEFNQHLKEGDEKDANRQAKYEEKKIFLM